MRRIDTSADGRVVPPPEELSRDRLLSRISGLILPWVHRSVPARYALAALCVLAVTAINLAVEPLASSHIPFALYYVAALIATLAGGFEPGVIALGLGGVVGWYLFLVPLRTFALPPPAEAAALVLYVVAGTIIATAGGALRHAVARLEAARTRLHTQVDALRAMTAELAEARREAEEANAGKSRFLAQASHELRQPIHAIGLFAECLKGLRLGPEGRDLIAQIDRSLDSMTHLFRSLLDIAALDLGQVTPRLVDVRLDEVLSGIVRQCEPLARAHRVHLRRVHTRTWVHTDPALLHVILQNLVSNAIKYGPGGEVLIGCRRSGSAVSIHVLDRGPGIAEEDLARIFEEFVRIEHANRPRVNGLGLGLSVVRRSAQLLSLLINADSTIGRGTRMRISGLPRAVPAAQPEIKSAVRRSLNHLAGFRVLVVDDDRAVLDGTCRLLTRWGCSVRATHVPPREAVDADFLLIDQDLGAEVTGLDAARRLRAVGGIPAALLTGDTSPSLTDAAHAVGIEVLPKPIRPAQLRSVLLAAATKQAQTSPASAATAAAAARVATPSDLNNADT